MLARNCVTVSPIRSGSGHVDEVSKGGGRPGGGWLGPAPMGRERPGGGRLGPAPLGIGRPGGGPLEPLGSGRPGGSLVMVEAVKDVSNPGLERSPLNSLARVANRLAII